MHWETGFGVGALFGLGDLLKLEGIIVCKDYSDFLEYTLPENIEHFDRLIVVTHPGDEKTKSICRKYSVEVVETTCMHDDGDAFNKGRCINLGQGHCRGLDWFLHLDADIVLPHRFKDMLHRAKLDKANIYGADRVNVYGCDHWLEHRHKAVPHYSQGYFVEPPQEFKFGARIVHYEIGYTPIGYFQLWHNSQHKRYPIHQGNAEHTDVLFAAQWPRPNRVLLPEVIVYHLESEESHKMGANWNGRKTKEFKPERHHCGHKLHHGHHYKPHDCNHK